MSLLHLPVHFCHSYFNPNSIRIGIRHVFSLCNKFLSMAVCGNANLEDNLLCQKQVKEVYRFLECLYYLSTKYKSTNNFTNSVISRYMFIIFPHAYIFQMICSKRIDVGKPCHFLRNFRRI